MDFNVLLLNSCQICSQEDRNKRTSSHQPNAWEFLIDEKNKIIYCPIFKAASSSWLQDFAFLGGGKKYLDMTKTKSPIEVSRKLFPR